MQIVILLALCTCLPFIEANDKAFVLTDVDLDADLLLEIDTLRDELRQERQLRVERDQLHKQRLADIVQKVTQLQLNNNGLLARAPAKRSTPSEPASRYSAQGCIGDTVKISCPANAGKIKVIDAIIGKLEFACAEGTCCPPNPYTDCTAVLKDVEAPDWIYITTMCNNKTECEYHYNGRFIHGCEGSTQGVVGDIVDSSDDVMQSDVANYIQIFYDCLSGTEEGPVGFTAHATSTRRYGLSETIVFADVQTNIGSFYNGQTSSFRCPYKGIYLFSLSFNAHEDYFMYMELVRDNVLLARSMAYGEHPQSYKTFNHASSLVVVECDVAQVVWARSTAKDNGYMFSPGNERMSQFAGYLLHRYE